MRFVEPLIPGRLIRRYKRFLADVECVVPDGDEPLIRTVHCPNPGSMRTCLGAGRRVMLSHSNNPKRRLPYTLEMIHNGRCWIGVNSILPNRLAEEALHAGSIPELTGYRVIERERGYDILPGGGEGSRVDFRLSGGRRRKICYVEVKNVNMMERGAFRFPDAVTLRGRRHLRELAAAVEAGARAVLLFIIQRGDARHLEPADYIDPEYAQQLAESHERGVEVIAYRARVTTREIAVVEKVPVLIPGSA